MIGTTLTAEEDLNFIKANIGSKKNKNDSKENEDPLSNYHNKTDKRGKKKQKYQDQNIAVKKDAVQALQKLRESLMHTDDTYFAMGKEWLTVRWTDDKYSKKEYKDLVTLFENERRKIIGMFKLAVMKEWDSERIDQRLKDFISVWQE